MNLFWIFGLLVKTGVVMFGNGKLNKIKCKRSLLEVSSYWIWVLKVTEGFSSPFSSRWGG